ncbi:Rv1733c family protein [Streptomyces mexicanus]|uniref:Rv1733c family protein n=1 Tax=Streptomyces mexicanus TaxID=178566 RepID=UPI0031EF1816
MSGRTKAKQRLWRWRSSPLRRHEDVAEAWIILATWVLILVGGAIIWTVTARFADQEFAWQRADRHAVTAVLLSNAPPGASTGTDSYRSLAKVRWTAADGTTHTGRTLMPAGLPIGATVTIWQDGRGALTTAPPGPGEGQVQAILYGGAAAGAYTGLVYVTAALARWQLDKRRYEQWGAEWDTIGPRWDQKTG